MKEQRRFRRCAVLMIEPHEQLQLDLEGLLLAGETFTSRMSCLALAPHLGVPVEIDADELLGLVRIGETPWLSQEKLGQLMPFAVAERLLQKGLLMDDSDAHATLRERDDAVREGHWRPLSAVAHYFSRWSDTGVDEDARITRHCTAADLVAEYGPPPPHLVEKRPPGECLGLPTPEASPLDDLFRRRTTCRNFDTSTTLAREQLSSLLQRVLGCLAIVEVVPGAYGLKKAHPSGGGLHPLEPYLLIHRVDGVDAGLYHYHAGKHVLEPISRLPTLDVQRLAKTFVAGQEFFAEAHVHVVLAARFRRTFWKYRNHPKAYRAIVLEAGHVSQNIYLAATEAGMGAYVTAAINEIDIERAFGLDPLCESPVAVCGFGPRAMHQSMMEFDPLRAVWGEGGTLRPV